MNIVYASDDNFAEIMGISMISLFESNKDCGDITVFILDDGIAGENKEKLMSVGRKYGRKIFFISVSGIEIPSSVQSERWSKSAFIRLYMRKLLPRELDRILYLDCDVIVLGDLKPLYETDMGSCTAAGVRDCLGRSYLQNIGLEPDGLYCNSGVLLIRPDKWDEEEFIRFFRNNSAIRYPDQDIINGVCSRETAELPPEYNCYTALFDFSYSDLMLFRKPCRYYSEEDTDKAKKSPVIIHFTSSFLSLRPWVEGCGHPYAGEWLRFKAMSPWSDTPLRKDNRSAAKKLAVKIYNVLPKGISVRIAGALHARIVPMFRRIMK